MKVKINSLAFEEKHCIKIRDFREPNAYFFCGSFEFISSGNEVELAFKTFQSRGQYRGFFLNYVTYQETNNFITSNKSTIGGTLNETGLVC